MATINDTLTDVNNALASLETAVSGNLSAASNAQKIKGFPVADLSAMPDGAIFRYNSTSGEIEPLEGLGDFSGAQDGDLLKWNATNGRFEVATPSDITFAVEDLSNTPNSLTGSGNKVLVGNSGETGFLYREYTNPTVGGFELKAKIGLNYRISPPQEYSYRFETTKERGLIPYPLLDGDPEIDNIEASTILNDATMGSVGLGKHVLSPFVDLDRLFRPGSDSNKEYFWQYNFPSPVDIGTIEIGGTFTRNRARNFDIITISGGTETVQKTVDSTTLSGSNILRTIELASVVNNVDALKLKFYDADSIHYIQAYSQTGLGSQYQIKHRSNQSISVRQGFLSRIKEHNNDLYCIVQQQSSSFLGSTGTPISYPSKSHLLKYNPIEETFEFVLDVNRFSSPKFLPHSVLDISSDSWNSALKMTLGDPDLIESDFTFKDSHVYLRRRFIRDLNDLSFLSRVPSNINGPSIETPKFREISGDKLFKIDIGGFVLEVIDVTDPTSPTHISTITPVDNPDFADKMGVAGIDSGDDILYIPLETSNKVLCLSTVDYTKVTELAVGVDPKLCAISPTLGKGVSVNQYSFSVFDLVSKSNLATLNVKNDPSSSFDFNPTSVAINSNRSEAVGVLNGSQELIKIDLDSNSIVERTTLEEKAYWITYSEAHNQYFVTTEEGKILIFGEI